MNQQLIDNVNNWMRDVCAGLDYYTLLRASKRLDASRTSHQVRVALLSDAATQQFVPLLRVLFHNAGVDAVIYEAPFDGIQLEVFNPNSDLYRF